jgi:hypothetical protein
LRQTRITLVARANPQVGAVRLSYRAGAAAALAPWAKRQVLRLDEQPRIVTHRGALPAAM